MSENYSNLSLLYEKFNKLEEDMNLLNIKIKGVLFWERLRFRIFKGILNASKDISDKQVVTKKTKIAHYIKAILKIWRNPFLVRKKDLLIFCSPRRKLKDDNKWWDIYTDYFVNKLSLSSISIERDFIFKHYKPSKTSNLKYWTFIDVLTNLKRLFRIPNISISNEEKEMLISISAELNARFGFKINLINEVISLLTRRFRILPLYVRILRKIKPKVAIVIVSYGKENFIEACKKTNIPVIELQHGVINRFHVAYSFEGKSKKKFFPDYFLSFGDYWNESVEFPIDKGNVISVGFPEFENQIELFKEISKQKQILFISQPTTSGKELSQFADILSKRDNTNYKIVYKLHPREYQDWKERYPCLVDKNIEVIGHKGKELYHLFAESEIQIGVNSTALFEGISFGLDTYLLNTFGIEYMEDLLSSGAATLINSVNDFLAKLKINKQKKVDSESFFKKNSITNIINIIEEIAKKQK